MNQNYQPQSQTGVPVGTPPTAPAVPPAQKTVAPQQVPPRPQYGMPQGAPVPPAPQGRPHCVPQQGVYYYPNGYPIYPGNPYYGDPEKAREDYEKRLKVQKAKKSLRYLGNMSGLSVILFLVFNTVASIVLSSPGLLALYRTNAVFSAAFSIVSSFIYMFIPFVIVACLIRIRDKQVEFFPFKKMNARRALLSIPIGLTVCIGANIVVNLIISAFEHFGFKLSQQSDAMAKPTSIFAVIITIVSTAVVPALLEEFAIRGVILQPARRYGMAFAIISSSVIFGIMHGNLIQAPFAFIVGMCFAFFAIKCDSLWIGVILHFINNAFSVIIGYLSEKMSEATLNLTYYIIIGVVVLAGIACFVILLVTDKQFFKKTEGNIAGEEATLLSKGQKFVAYFINAPMIISFVLIFLLTLQYISK